MTTSSIKDEWLQKKMERRRAELARKNEQDRERLAKKFISQVKTVFMDDMTKWKLQRFCGWDCDYTPGLDDGVSMQDRNEK